MDLERARTETRLVETLISLGLLVLFCVIGFAASAGPETMIWGGVGLAFLGLTAVFLAAAFFLAAASLGDLPAMASTSFASSAWTEPTIL